MRLGRGRLRPSAPFNKWWLKRQNTSDKKIIRIHFARNWPAQCPGVCAPLSQISRATVAIGAGKSGIGASLTGEGPALEARCGTGIQGEDLGSSPGVDSDFGPRSWPLLHDVKERRHCTAR